MINDYEIALTLLRHGNYDVMRKTFAKKIPEVIDFLEEKMAEFDEIQATISELENKIEELDDINNDLRNENVELSEMLNRMHEINDENNADF